MLTRPIQFLEFYKAIPSNITIGVNEKVTIQVGNCNAESGEFAPVQDWFFFADRFVSFSVEFPYGNPGGAWFVNFNPPSVSQKKTLILVTNATISLTSLPIVNEPIQSTIIRINITDTWVVKNVWWPEYQYWDELPEGLLVPWVLGSLITGGYGGISGKILTDYYNIDILVKVKPFHAAKIQALPPEKLTPNQVTTIPVLVQNQGNYNDTFNFQIRAETGYPLILTNNGTITLRPGEQGRASVGVAVPANILDTGTLHSLIIETYSAEQPNTSIATQRIFVETQGVYLSEQNIVYTIGFGFFLLFVLFLIIYWKRKVSGKNSKKPEKPWKIPEEQQYLQELKRTDKKAYEQERIMMKDEYKSALVWYKDHRKTLRKKLKETKPIKFLSTIFKKEKTSLKMTEKTKKKPAKSLSTIFKKAKTSLKMTEKTKKKPAKSLSTIFKKSEQPLKTEQKKKQPSILAKDITKEKALAKIKREQEKQLRKMNI